MLSSLPVIWYIDDARQWRHMDSFSCLKNKQMDTWLSGKLIAPGNVAKTDQWHLCSAFVFLRFLLFGCFRFSLVFQWFWCLGALSLILGCINAIWIIIDTSLIKWLNSWLSCDQTLHVLFVVTGLYCFPQLVTFIRSHYKLIHGAKSCRFFFFFPTLGSVRCQKRDEEKQSADGQKHYSRIVLWERKKYAMETLICIVLSPDLN